MISLVAQTRMSSRLLPLFILLLVAPDLACLASQQSRTTDLRITYYRLKLRITGSPRSISGSVLVRAISKSGQLRNINLDLMRSTAMVDSVLVGARPVKFLQDSAFFTAELDTPRHMDESFDAEVFYHSVDEYEMYPHFVFRSDSDDKPWMWSVSEPDGAKFWWPCRDHPSEKADSADIIVTVDDGLMAGSNGKLISRVKNEDHTVTYHWHERYPVSTYLISIAIGNFVAFSEWWKYSNTDSMEVLNYVFPSVLTEARDSLHVALDGLTIFSKLFGLYPFVTEKYGHVECGTGMEHQTMASLSYLAWDETTVIHEVAHQWFGDMITCRSWGDFWLNEGFATYCEALYKEQRYGKPAYETFMQERIDSARRTTGSIFISDTNDIMIMFDGNLVYRKGAVVLHMLRHILGDSAFFRAMHGYANDPNLKYGVATTRDFESSCEKSSGKNLRYFFDEWIYGGGHPQYTFSWRPIHHGGSDSIAVKILQTPSQGARGVFTMPIDLKIRADGKDTTVTVVNNAADQEFRIRVPAAPELVLLDPDNWILK